MSNKINYVTYPRRIWTSDEVTFLHNNSDCPVSKLAFVMQRSVKAIERKKCRLRSQKEMYI